jgi:hypothetical protein
MCNEMTISEQNIPCMPEKIRFERKQIENWFKLNTPSLIWIKIQ